MARMKKQPRTPAFMLWDLLSDPRVHNFKDVKIGWFRNIDDNMCSSLEIGMTSVGATSLDEAIEKAWNYYFR